MSERKVPDRIEKLKSLSVIVSAHQPNFLPWLGFFHKMIQVDKFILLDTAQFTKNGFQNRVQIATPQGVQWLTVPILTSGRFGQLTYEVEIDRQPKWREKILRTLQMNYARAEYFDWLFPRLQEVFYGEDWRLLSQFNVALITEVASLLTLRPQFVLASDLKIRNEFTATEILVELCKEVGGTVYLSGASGRNYLTVDTFKLANLSLKFHDFEHPLYTQRRGVFSSGLSIVDLLFNCGPKSYEILSGKDF